MFEGSAAIAKVGGEPVEQFGMSRLRAHVAEVVRGIDKARAEMIVPDTIDD